MMFVAYALVFAAAVGGAVVLVLHGHPWMALAVLACAQFTRFRS